MELRLLELVVRLLDPRKWRLRLAQLAFGLLATTWVWVRAVQGAPVERAVRDVHRAERNARIRARNDELEARRLAD